MQQHFPWRWLLGLLMAAGLPACGSSTPPEDPAPPPLTVLEANELLANNVKAMAGKVKVDQNDPDKPLLEVDLSRTATASSHLEPFEKQLRLQVLNLNGTLVEDEGLEYLSKLSELRVLQLNGCRITDRGLEQLKGLTQLQELYLVNCVITDHGLEPLAGLTKLRLLKLEGNHVTKVGVAKLQKALPNTKITHTAK